MILFCVATAAFVSSTDAALSAQDSDGASAACPTAPSIGVPVCVTTYHNQNSRKGINYNETMLTKSAIGAGGLHYLTTQSVTVDGQVYAQPLFLPAVDLSSLALGTRNVVYVATEKNKVYLIDADSGVVLNTMDLLQQLNQQQITTGQFAPPADLVCTNIYPNIGITGTPAISITSSSTSGISTAVIYLVSRGKTTDQFGVITYHQNMWALSANFTPITNVEIAPQLATAHNGTVKFDPKWQNQRPALLYQKPYVYVSWGAHCDQGSQHASTATWHGWVLAYQLSGSAFLTPAAWLASEYPEAGIWGSGAGLAGDGTSVYLPTGNGSITAEPYAASGNNESPCTGCYGNSIIGLNYAGTTFTIKGSFPPADQATRFCGDVDIGSSGVVLVPSSGFSHSNLLLESGKGGTVFLLDYGTAQNWGYGGPTSAFTNCTTPPTGGTDSSAILTIPGTVGGAAAGLCWSTAFECGMQGTPVFWNNYFYFGARCQPISQYQLGGSSTTTTLAFLRSTTQGGTQITGCGNQSVPVYRYPGASLAISQAGSAGVLWAVDSSTFLTSNSGSTPGPAVLWAYDATTLAQIPLVSATQPGLTLGSGNAVKFSVPTVVNGHVYVGGDGQLTIVSKN